MPKPDFARQRELAELFAAAIDPLFDRPAEQYLLADKAASNAELLTNDDLIKELNR